MSNAEILVIEDEEDILELIAFNLTREGYAVRTVMTGEDGIRETGKSAPDLILLDLMLPGIDGLEVCRTLKSDATTRDIPLLMLTAKSEEADIVAGLELGADDYITKPFSRRVLLARIRAVLRRGSRREIPEAEGILQRHELRIDPGRHEVLVSGEAVSLTFTEFRVLQFLATRPGWVFTRSQIVEAVRGDGYPVTDRSVDVQIVGLRKKLGDAGRHIETVRGVGYRFTE
ncbi:MAG: response regulator transcription factor [Bacteroidota bacterium]|jgi:two-component system phosphate regulon response regulator PhoB|nr:response regulator transcription factor [Bacteroidota bacterium]